MMLGWPGDWLQPEISTPGFNVGISEIAEFQTLRLGVLITIKEILLGVYDRLTNPHGTATATQLPQLAHFLDMKPALTWIQFILLEDLTHSPLQLATLQDTFGPLGEKLRFFCLSLDLKASSFSTTTCKFPILTGYWHRNTA